MQGDLLSMGSVLVLATLGGHKVTEKRTSADIKEEIGKLIDCLTCITPPPVEFSLLRAGGDCPDFILLC